MSTDDRPALRAGVRLRHDQARDQWVLLAPERVVELDEIAAVIVRRLDGDTSVGQIAATLAQEYDADPALIGQDIAELVADLRGKRLLRP